MKKVVIVFSALLITMAFLLAACPRTTPKVGLRKDNRAERMDSYVAEELDPSRGEWQAPERVIEAVGVRPGDKVAVAWAGAGYFIEPLSKAVGPEGVVYASDPDEAMIEKLKQEVKKKGLTNVKIIKSRLEDAQLPYGGVDIAFVVNSQVYIDLPYAFFDTLRRGVKTGGKLVVIDWRRRSRKGPDKKLRRKKKDMIEILEGMELELMSDHDFLPYQYFLIFRVVERYGEASSSCGT